MGIDKDKKAAAELRRQAEERLQEKRARSYRPLVEEDAKRLVQELEVHQIELEVQNEELRKARNDMEKALEKYTDLYDFAPVAYFTLDREGSVSAANLRGAGLLGVERRQLIGRRFGLFVARESLALFSEFLAKAFAGKGKESCEVALAAEGDRPQVFVQMEAVAEASGEKCDLAAIDVTDRKRAGDELAENRRELGELNDSLEMRVAQAVDDVRRKDQMLIVQARLAAMGEMINNIAHQWRQPLNSLALVVQQVPLYYDAGEFSREFLRENTAKAMELILHMSKTVEDFMNFFKRDKKAVDFNLNQLIAATLSLVDWIFKEKSIAIVLQGDADPVVNGYPNEYAQVLLNILMNAHDALVAGDVDEPLVTIRTTVEGGKSVVTIADNAGGIPEEFLDKLFDPYFSTKGADNGTGIGLFMSKTIIEKNMGGALTVRNIRHDASGGGAEFRIVV